MKTLPLKRVTAAMLLVLACATVPVHAGLFDKDPADAAADAARQGLAAATVWVDASWGFRNQGAANDLTKAHTAFAAHGYKVEDVEPYIENGDLQGFFVTYRAGQPCDRDDG